MNVREIKVLRGPNYWSIRHKKLIQILLDLEEHEYLPTNKIPGFYERIQQLLPSLYEHQCSEGHPGGFFERVKDGTWMGHVIEHIALEIQTLAGIDVGFGRTRGAGVEGLYYVIFSYKEEKAGLKAAEAAVNIARALINGETYDLEQDVKAIHDLWVNERLGPSTWSIVEEAQKRNIPYIRLDDNSLVQLGYGAKQKRIEATITSHTSQLAVDIAGNKHIAKTLLAAANVPVPAGSIASDVEDLEEIIKSVGYPIVIKPLNGNHGKGATVNITNFLCALRAFERAKKISDEVIVEKFITGFDFRVLVVNYKFQAASLRKPASIIGNGRDTVEELIAMVNEDPKRGCDHEKPLTKIIVDEVLKEWIAKQNCTLKTILSFGQELFLKPTANLSTGGTATDVTDEVHLENIATFERIAKIVGLDICGIDVMAPDLCTPIRKNNGVVLEINAAPGFRMHLEPTSGHARPVARPVVDMLFKDDGRIPIIAVTGTNGKTTTTRLIAHMAQQDGKVVGYTTTDGIYINSEQLVSGDCSGPASARTILCDPTVEFAVLETARGGILRTGLAFDQCDVAVITNIAEDHLGKDGIDSLDQLAKVKGVIAESVHEKGYTVLNADDEMVYKMKEKLNCNVALFSIHSNNIRIEEHCNNGGVAAVYENGYVLIRNHNHFIPIEEVENIPICFGGKAEFNIYNVLAATLASYVAGISTKNISKAVLNLKPTLENTPGRMNIFEFKKFTVIVDYAHNPHGLKALGKFIKSKQAIAKIGIITGVGDRRDQDLIAIGEEAAKIFDRIIIRYDSDMRGRTIKEMEALVTLGIKNVDSLIPITCGLGECESVEFAVRNAPLGSLIVVLADDINKVSGCLIDLQKREISMPEDLQKAV
ncbi:MAG TPA: cyanophycin synthetase [Flavisolibacter sp.]|nr:cyanophycin synthetase [Flavisolibacter sp.]